MSTFLIVDQDENRSADICSFFRSIGHSLYEAPDYPSAMSQLGQRDWDVVVSSVAISGGTIHELIQAVKRKNPDTAVIVHADLETTQEGLKAVQEGAFSIVQNPFSIPELSFQIKRALEKKGQKSVPSSLAGLYRDVYQPYNFIGESAEIRKVFRIVNRVAKTDSSVIITGETGTGKELVAGAIHYNSSRAGGHFVRVNCAALPEQLLESEPFGYEKGAFTGADRVRIGRFEHASGGTIFLDEVADMSLFTQAKVLRVIQEKEFERLGSNTTVKTDVRIISATNKDLMDLMRRSLFREDLYYRLNVVTIRLPPLRERDGDIALLIQFFLKKYSAEMNKKIKGIEPGAMKMLTGYHWPGNIRELENAMERAVLMAEGDGITTEDLNLFFAGEGPQRSDERIRLPAAGIHLEDAERELIEQALERCKWVQKDAARLL
ncbi:MAG: sigma-54-dependent Fis family transcriptional regulator, partial [Spirochaetes bacterium]|nr:sigma-54-dependent Fis family transcriptional regulator [Spirochaetota bacterium]